MVALPHASAFLTALLLLTPLSSTAQQAPGRPDAQAPRGQPRTPPRDPRDSAPQPLGTATIAGQVLGIDGTVVRRARVLIEADTIADGRAASTGDDGRFEFTGLPSGHYTVTVSKPGFVTMTFGQRRPRQPGLPLQLRDGERLGGVDFRLPRGSVVTGRVFDENGTPLVRAMVTAMRYDYLQGERRLVRAGFDTADDRGEYRIFDLTPGEYYISATAPTDRSMRFMGGPPFGGGFGVRGGDSNDDEDTGYAPTYYPGLINPADASPVTVRLGQELTGVDFSVQRVPTARVSGIVAAPDGKPPRAGLVMLIADVGAGIRSRLQARIEPDGTFTVRGVAPGRYRLQARAQAEGLDAALTATAPVNVVSGDLSGIVVTLTPGITMSGRLAFEGGSPPAAAELARTQITARSTEGGFGGGGNASSGVDGSYGFTLTNVAPGPRLIRTQRLPSGWFFKSVLVGDRDALDQPIEIPTTGRLDNLSVVVTSQAAELSGTVRTAMGEPAVDYTVILFPADPELWHPLSFRTGGLRVDHTGQYRFTGIMPGRYLLALVEFVEDEQWTDAAFLDRLKDSALPLQIGESERKVQDLSVR